MPLLERIKALLLNPKGTWAVIEQEPSDPRQLYTGYLMRLAAIPAVAGFIGYSVIGASAFGVTYRVPLLVGLSQMLVSYVLSLVSVYLLSLIINVLAPRFGGTAHALNALKVAVYGATASLLGGIFALLPSLAMLGLLAGLYSIYLVYLGLPVLMKNPPEKSLAYTAVTLVCAVVLAIIVGAVSAAVLPRSALGGASSFGAESGSFSINTPDGTVQVNGDQFEELGRRAAEASASGDPKALAEVMGGAMSAVVGTLGSTTAAGESLTTDQMAEAMNAAASDLLRSAAGGSVAAGTRAGSEVEIPPIPDAPDASGASGNPVADSPYGLGKKKLAPPPARGACLSKAERDEALMGSGCDCSCDGYARNPEARCQTACGLVYYTCWAPDPSDAELGAKITDPQARQMIAAMSAEERGQMLQHLRAAEMLERATAWEEAQLCAE